MRTPCRIALAVLTTALLNGLASRASAQQINDEAFAIGVDNPAHRTSHPRVGMDASHNNIFVVHTSRAAPLVQLMLADGMVVDTLSDGLTPSALGEVDVAVILTAALDGFGTGAPRPRPAFSEAELRAVDRFVADGGSLLFCVDHTPFGAAGMELASQFGVKLFLGVVEDSVTSGTWLAGSYTSPIHTRENGGLGHHPVLEGRDSTERIQRVAVFGGISMVPPRNATLLLLVPPTAWNRGERGTPMSELGTAQAVALTHGQGRVVITGDCTMWTAQILSGPHGDFRIGMAREDIDNRQFAVNVLRWLSGAL